MPPSRQLVGVAAGSLAATCAAASAAGSTALSIMVSSRSVARRRSEPAPSSETEEPTDMMRSAIPVSPGCSVADLWDSRNGFARAEDAICREEGWVGGGSSAGSKSAMTGAGGTAVSWTGSSDGPEVWLDGGLRGGMPAGGASSSLAATGDLSARGAFGSAPRSSRAKLRGCGLWDGLVRWADRRLPRGLRLGLRTIAPVEMLPAVPSSLAATAHGDVLGDSGDMGACGTPRSVTRSGASKLKRRGCGLCARLVGPERRLSFGLRLRFRIPPVGGGGSGLECRCDLLRETSSPPSWVPAPGSGSFSGRS